MKKIERPQATEYAEFYKTYVDLVEGNVVEFLEKQMPRLLDICHNLSEQQRYYRYAEGKWSIKELIGHCIDTERVMSYRLMRIARKDSTNLPGFDENEYVNHADFDKRDWDSLLQEFQALRTSNILLIKSLTDEMITSSGTANNKTVSARALIYIIAGHLEHHLGILIRRYLK